MNDNCLEDINRISDIIDNQNKLIIALQQQYTKSIANSEK